MAVLTYSDIQAKVAAHTALLATGVTGSVYAGATGAPFDISGNTLDSTCTLSGVNLEAGAYRVYGITGGIGAGWTGGMGYGLTGSFKANLSGATGVGVDFSGANLRGADLHGSSFKGSNFRGTNLDGANLDGANVSCAQFCNANLAHAGASGTNMVLADLRNADLSGISFTKPKM